MDDNTSADTPKRFYSSRFKHLGVRKDRAANAAKILNLMINHGKSLRETIHITGLNEVSVRRILKDSVVISELEKCNGTIRLRAIANLANKLDSTDEKVSVQASKILLENLDRKKEQHISATSVDMSALVTQVAGNLLASAMLGVMTDNTTYQSLDTTGNQALSIEMGSASTVDESSSSNIPLATSSVTSTDDDN